MIIERSLNNAARALRNEIAEQVLNMEEDGATLDDLFPLLDGNRARECFISGDTAGAVFHCGQVVGLCREILSAREIIQGIISEADATLKRLNDTGS